MKDIYRQHLQEGEQAGMRYCLNIPQDAMKGSSGMYLGRLTGSSIDFKDYREYQPGDDLRSIDWSVYGRTDKLIVKMYHEEVNPHLDIILDGSRSMNLPESEKVRGALGLGAVFASAAANTRCSHSAWFSADGYQQVANGSEPPGHWDGLEFDARISPAEAYGILPPKWRRNGVRVLISDLLWVGDPLLLLRPLADGAARVIVVQLLAATDVDPKIRGNSRLVDVESGDRLEVFIDALSEKRYSDALSRHQQNWHHACRQVGASLVTMVAEDIVGNWRLDPLEAAQVLGAA